MNKKVGIVIITILAIIITVIGILMFIGFGRKLKSSMYSKIDIPQETVPLDNQENIDETNENFKTNKITITKNIMDDKKISVLNEYKLNIEEKATIDYIVNQCKNIYTKEVIYYQPNIVTPDYKIDFNNNVELLIYKGNPKGWMLKDGFLSEAYNLDVFDKILEDIFDNIKYDNYKKISSLSSKTVSTEILVKFDGILYGKSFSVIDYAGGSEPIGTINKLIDSEYVPKLDGETNTKEIFNALVFDKTNNTIVLEYNNNYVLFQKIK